MSSISLFTIGEVSIDLLKDTARQQRGQNSNISRSDSKVHQLSTVCCYSYGLARKELKILQPNQCQQCIYECMCEIWNHFYVSLLKEGIENMLTKGLQLHVFKWGRGKRVMYQFRASVTTASLITVLISILY